MHIVDSQQHELGPVFDWPVEDRDVQHAILAEILVNSMDAVGVDAALVNPIDSGLARTLIENYPYRFAIVQGFHDLSESDLDGRVATLRQQPGAVAVRTSFGKSSRDPAGEAAEQRFRAGAFDPLFAACERHGVVLFCSAYGKAALIGHAAERYPGLTLVADHMALAQPPIHPRETPPWLHLPELLALGRYPNVAVKLCGVPAFAEEPFPYPDVWPHVRRILDAFGAERVMWASDIGRFYGRIGWNKSIHPEAQHDYAGRHTYAESLFLLRETDQLSKREKELILGGTARRLVNWPLPEDQPVGASPHPAH
jgi:L-fuconolactonase